MRFGEPTWNNPVVRFLRADAQDLIPRRDRVWDLHGLSARMAEALRAAGRPVPRYLELLVEEHDPAPLAKATFAMHCYWEGEAQLGALDGVLATRAGWDGQEEVVEVTYRPARIAAETLRQRAATAHCRPQPRAPQRDVEESERKHYLRQTLLNLLPLTPLQVVRVNAALGLHRDAEAFLSPRQRALLRQVEHTSRTAGGQLDGLQRPESIADWMRYEEQLRARLL